MSTTTTSSNNKPSLREGTTKQSHHHIPKLRFKEFEGEWKPSKLINVTKYVKGFAFKSDDYQDNGVRIVRVSDLAADRIKTDNDKLYIDEQKALDFDKYKLRTGNIVITTVGSKPEMLESAVGRGIYIHNDNEGLLNQNMLKFENIEGVSNGFIIGLINSRRYQHYMKGIARGNANQANITVVDLLQYNISYPSLPEQQKIASFLSAVDEKIQQLTKKKALLEQYKKGVMQQLFSGKLRFKDENGNPYPDWEEKRLGEIISIFNGYAFSSSDSQDSGCRWIKIADVGINEMKSDTVSYLPEEFVEKHSKFILRKGDFVIALTRPILNGKLKIAKVNEDCDNSLLNQRVGKLESTFYLPFTYYLLQLKELIYKMDSRIAGTDPPNLSPNEINGIKLNISTKLEEQQKIATYLSSIDTKIESVNNQITQTQTFKKGLLQQLFV